LNFSAANSGFDPIVAVTIVPTSNAKLSGDQKYKVFGASVKPVRYTNYNDVFRSGGDGSSFDDWQQCGASFTPIKDKKWSDKAFVRSVYHA
jgi:hypothetical protein